MLMAGASVESVSQELSLEWRVELSATRLASQLPRPVRDAAFTMPAGDAATLRTVALPGEGYAIVQLARVTPGEPSAITQNENQQLVESPSKRAAATELRRVSYSSEGFR